MKFSRTVLLVAVTIVTVVALNSNVTALPIISSPQHIGSPFTNNVFHTSTNGGGSGTILAWFDLQLGETNTYDPLTGDLHAHFTVFSNSGLSNVIGMVTATGMLPAADFTGANTMDIGTLTWAFSGLQASALMTYLGGITTPTLTYRDNVFGSTGANTWQNGKLTLWGSGLLSSHKYLGTDVALQTVPEPATFSLFAVSLFGFIGYGWQRKRRA